MSNELINQLNAWILMAAALLATTEMLHQQHATTPTAIGSGQVPHSVVEGMSARAEGTRETARLPEEYDIGLRMPAISGM